MCWFSMAKLFMFVFNFALFAAGAATLGVGIWISETSNSVELIGVTISQNGAIVLMIAGGITLGMGFLGCCGARKESTGLLGLYFFLLLIIVIAEIAVGIWAAVNYDSVGGVVKDSLGLLNVTDQADIDTLDSLSDEFKCCGNTDDPCGENTVALECGCDREGPTCGSCAGSAGELTYNQTCTDAITNALDDNMKIIAGIGIGIGLLEILGLVFSWCMCQAIKDHKGYA